MLSTEVHRWLAAVDAGETPDEAALLALIDRRWVERLVYLGDPERLASLRAELRGVQEIRADAARHPNQRAMLDDASLRERELRLAILDLSEASARGDRPLALTWRGRELLGELQARLGGLDGVDVDTFEARMTELAFDLATVASRGAELLPRLARAGSGAVGVRDLTLKSVALGLGAHPSGPDAAVDAWLAALAALPSVELAPDTRATLAEALVAHHPGGVSKVEVDSAWRRVSVGVSADDAAALLAVTGVTGQVEGMVVERLKWVRADVPDLDPVGAALLLAGGVDTDAALLEDARRVSAALGGDLPVDTRGRVVALLALAPGDADVALARYRPIRAWLASFLAEDAALSAATLCLLWAGPDAILDDLRIASEAVERAKLGTSGLGSLALGARVLLLAAGHAPRGLMPTLATGRGAVPTRRLLPATSTFHHGSMHRAALVAWQAARLRALHPHHHGG